MANGHGGYRRPNNPAPVSGPGAFSQRTDGGPGETETQAARYISGGAYGEGSQLMDLQQSAPMSAASTPDVVELSAPTQRPDEPISYGAPFGDGPESPFPTQEVSIDEIARDVRMAYVARPNEDTLALLERIEAMGK